MEAKRHSNEVYCSLQEFTGVAPVHIRVPCTRQCYTGADQTRACRQQRSWVPKGSQPGINVLADPEDLDILSLGRYPARLFENSQRTVAPRRFNRISAFAIEQ